MTPPGAALRISSVICHAATRIRWGFVLRSCHQPRFVDSIAVRTRNTCGPVYADDTFAVTSLANWCEFGTVRARRLVDAFAVGVIVGSCTQATSACLLRTVDAFAVGPLVVSRAMLMNPRGLIIDAVAPVLVFVIGFSWTKRTIERLPCFDRCTPSASTRRVDFVSRAHSSRLDGWRRRRLEIVSRLEV